MPKDNQSVPRRTAYQLPSHPFLLSDDPLGFCDTGATTHWDIITTLINGLGRTPNILQLPSLIEDLVYSLFGDGKIDLSFLKSWLIEFESSAGSTLVNLIMGNILASCLSLPALFPSHEIIHLGPYCPSIELSLAQIRALVANQILCTIAPPEGNNWGCTLRCWYSNPQPMDYAVRGYLETGFRFFIDVDEDQLAKTTVYQYFYSPMLPNSFTALHWQNCSAPLFRGIEIELVSAKTVHFPHPTICTMLVSSHKEPGFGSSCTQEEVVTAACPQLLPLGALLVQPPIPDHVVLVAQNVNPASRWVGQGRNARLQNPDGDIPMAPCTFLFLDALELDNVDSTQTRCMPDLIPENLIRELEKAYTGFSAISKLGVDRIVSPLWGTGAFGGDPIVKSLVLGMAAARAGISITLLIDEERSISHELGTATLLKDVLVQMKASLGSTRVADAWKALHSVSDSCNDPLDVLGTLFSRSSCQ